MAGAHTLAEPKLKSHHDVHLHSLTNAPTTCQPSTPYRIQEPIQDFTTHGHYDKVKSRSHQDVAHLHTLTNVPTKYQLLTPYGFRDMGQTRFYRSRSLRLGQRSNQGHTRMLHIYTPYNQCPYQVSTSYTLRFPRYIAQTRFYRSRSRQQGQIKVTPGHCTPIPPNQCPYQVSTSYTLRFPRYGPEKIFKLKVTAARS